METTSNLSDTRKELPTLVRNLMAHGGQHLVTKNGEPAAVLLSVAEYDSLIETLNIQNDRETMKAVTLGRAQIEAGEVVEFSDL